MIGEWIEGEYNTHSLHLSHSWKTTITISWAIDRKGGYKVTFLGHTLPDRYEDLASAKRMAIKFARNALALALNRLPMEENQ